MLQTQSRPRDRAVGRVRLAKAAGLMSLPTDVVALTKAAEDCAKEQDEFLQQLQSGVLGWDGG